MEVGTRLVLRRPENGEWAEATIVEFKTELLRGSKTTTYHRVSFGDDTKRWLSLETTEHEVLSAAASKHRRPPPEMEISSATRGQRANRRSTKLLAASGERARLTLKCELSQSRLTDPARGAACQHVSRFNYDSLLDFVLRTKRWATTLFLLSGVRMPTLNACAAGAP